MSASPPPPFAGQRFALGHTYVDLAGGTPRAQGPTAIKRGEALPSRATSKGMARTDVSASPRHHVWGGAHCTALVWRHTHVSESASNPPKGVGKRLAPYERHTHATTSPPPPSAGKRTAPCERHTRVATRPRLHAKGSAQGYVARGGTLTCPQRPRIALQGRHLHLHGPPFLSGAALCAILFAHARVRLIQAIASRGALCAAWAAHACVRRPPATICGGCLTRYGRLAHVSAAAKPSGSGDHFALCWRYAIASVSPPPS